MKNNSFHYYDEPVCDHGVSVLAHQQANAPLETAIDSFTDLRYEAMIQLNQNINPN
jgi:hypothetical protein